MTNEYKLSWTKGGVINNILIDLNGLGFGYKNKHLLRETNDVGIEIKVDVSGRQEEKEVHMSFLVSDTHVPLTHPGLVLRSEVSLDEFSYEGGRRPGYIIDTAVPYIESKIHLDIQRYGLDFVRNICTHVQLYDFLLGKIYAPRYPNSEFVLAGRAMVAMYIGYKHNDIHLQKQAAGSLLKFYEGVGQGMRVSNKNWICQNIPDLFDAMAQNGVFGSQ